MCPWDDINHNHEKHYLQSSQYFLDIYPDDLVNQDHHILNLNLQDILCPNILWDKQPWHWNWNLGCFLH